MSEQERKPQQKVGKDYDIAGLSEAQSARLLLDDFNDIFFSSPLFSSRAARPSVSRPDRKMCYFDVRNRDGARYVGFYWVANVRELKLTYEYDHGDHMKTIAFMRVREGPAPVIRSAPDKAAEVYYQTGDTRRKEWYGSAAAIQTQMTIRSLR